MNKNFESPKQENVAPTEKTEEVTKMDKLFQELEEAKKEAFSIDEEIRLLTLGRREAVNPDLNKPWPKADGPLKNAESPEVKELSKLAKEAWEKVRAASDRWLAEVNRVDR